MYLWKFKILFISLSISSFVIAFLNCFAFAESVDIKDKKISLLPATEILKSSNLNNPIKLEARIDVPLDLSLHRALDIALVNNLDIAQATYKKNLNKWMFLDNVGNWLPDYKLGLSTQRLDGNFLIGGIFPVMTLTSSANAYMRFDYRFFEGGKGLFNTIAAKNLYKSAKENLSSSLKKVLLTVTKSYNQLLKEHAQLDVLSKSLLEAQSQLDLNKKLEASGVGTKFDILQSEAQLAEVQQLFIEQQAKFRESSINLAKLLNIDQGIHIKPDEQDLMIKKIFNLNQPIDGILSLAFNNRAELKQAKLEYNAQKSYVGAAFSPFLPRANFFGQYGGNGNVFFSRTKTRGVIPDAIALDENGNPIVQMINREQSLSQSVDPSLNLQDINSVSNVIRGGGKPFVSRIDDSLMTSRFIGLQLDWDLGDGLGLNTISRINQARYQAKIAKTNIEIKKQQVEEEVRSAYLNLQVRKQLIEVSEKRAAAATEALRLAKLRLENGVGINTELLNAQKQYSASLASQVNAVTEYNNAQAELLHSLGLISVELLTEENKKI